MNNLSNWLTTEEACERLSLSASTLERMVKDNRGPQRAKRSRPGKKPEVVYNPDDVAAIAEASNKPYIVPATIPITGTEPAQSEAAVMPANLAAVFTLIGRLGEIAGSNRALPPKPLPLWLTIADAVEFTGLSDAFIRRAIREKRLPAVMDGSTWKIRRRDLVNFGTVTELKESTTAAGNSFQDHEA